MFDRLLRRSYERLGPRYMKVFLVAQIPVAALISFAVVAILSAYFDPSPPEVLLLATITAGLSAAAMALTVVRTNKSLAAMARWRGRGIATADETIEAWDSATNYAVRSLRRNSLPANAFIVLPSAAAMVAVLGLPAHDYVVVAAAGAITAAYGTIVTYSISEFVMRPAVEDIAAALPEEFDFHSGGLPLRKRLVLSLFAFTAMTALVVAAFVSDGAGTGRLTVAVVGSIVVGWALSRRLTLLLSHAITEPIVNLRDALARLARGDYDARVPVLSSDELGEVSNAFNRMAQGLAERERIREALGTYLDKEVAGFILSGNVPDDGVEVDVSIMFCDVPNFTPFAERATAPQIVAALNALFETLVPLIERHGGHVDKFIGDGLLAVFGAPEGFADHADRALAAGLEIVDALERGAGNLRVCIGINSGRVVAGSIGGAGRLNFSVIGDAVNVAARVEEATRTTGDELLLTRATSDALLRPAPLTSRGSILLKGKSDAVELLAPARRARAAHPARAVTATRPRGAPAARSRAGTPRR
ncbi:MAG TPA: adenylate/guanylate cyclase domain-containing protein [Solirubrobacteraceae bacterium]|jgi:class 3 adenylate cyclase/membrane protein YqaA with SNARE-associated domain|nr:adenylate/guanylate cyclase domain-containing protein [Solirubrobacteraceae bacterium]